MTMRAKPYKFRTKRKVLWDFLKKKAVGQREIELENEPQRRKEAADNQSVIFVWQ
jgi:hypothetical protein